MGSDEEGEIDSTLLALPQEYVAVARLLTGPREMQDQVTAAQALAKHRPTKGTPDLARVQEEMADQQALLALQVKKLASGDADATRKKVDSLAKQVAKLEDSAEGASVAAAEWELR